MNLSRSGMVQDETYVLEIFAPAAFAGSVFVINVCLFLCVSRIIRYGNSKRDKYGIFIHSLFVCIIDTFSGLEVFLVGLIKVERCISAFVCAILLVMSVGTRLNSQANIGCICAKRYVFSRNLPTTNMSWSKVYTKTLLVVNLIIGVASFAWLLAAMKVKYLTDRTVSCTLGNVTQGESAFGAAASIVIGIMCILLGDILCMLIIRKVRMSVNNQ